MPFAAIALPVFLWVVLRFIYPSATYEMDAAKTKGAFVSLMQAFSLFFYVMAGLSLWGYRESHEVLFLVPFVEALLICGLLPLFYESYLHVRYSVGLSNYTRGKYALILSLAYSTVITLAGVSVSVLR